jgi:hypothetical protein
VRMAHWPPRTALDGLERQAAQPVTMLLRRDGRFSVHR